MTVEGNEHAQPQPQDQSEANAPAATPEQRPLTVTSIEELTDPDLIELRDAEAAAKVEEAAAKPAEGEQVAGAAPAVPVEAKPQDPPAVPGKPRVAMIPKPRFDEVIGERDKALQDAAYLRGRLEAGTGPAPAPSQPAAPQQTPEQKLAAIHTEIDALAKKFDDGELTMADYKRQERTLTAKEQDIREEVLLGKVKPAAAPAQGQDGELYLETLTAELEKEHPWTGVFEQVGTKSDWDYLRAQAVDRLIERGVDPTKGGNLERYELRKEMAALADELGPALLTARATKAGIALPGQSPKTPQAAPAPRPALSPGATALTAKLALAAQAPPNLAGMQNAGGGGDGTPSAARIETMTDEEIAALPRAVQDKILGATA